MLYGTLRVVAIAPAAAPGTVRRMEQLRAVPGTVSYRGWRPQGRGLHLVDLENLAGWAVVDPAALASLARRLHRLARVRTGDHVVVATNPAQLMASAPAFPGARLLVGRGRDGADRALLSAAHAAEVAERYDRLVVMSGDHAFAPLAEEVRRLGRTVRVVAHGESLSARLRDAASEVVPVTPRPALRRAG